MNNIEIDNIENFEFAGYDFCGGYDDGYTIFMFVHKDDEKQGFTFLLRDHEGFDDHNEVKFEDGLTVSGKLKSGVLIELKSTVKEQDSEEVIAVINRCIAGLKATILSDI